MCHALLQTPAFFALLRRIDEDLMKVARDRGCCHCGSVLHSANYPRKPRGCPPAAHPDCNTRLSLCCAGCRKRMTPDSVRFLGRRVWLAIVLVLRSSRATGACLDGLPAISWATLKRWRQWWTETFPKTPSVGGCVASSRQRPSRSSIPTACCNRSSTTAKTSVWPRCCFCCWARPDHAG